MALSLTRCCEYETVGERPALACVFNGVRCIEVKIIWSGCLLKLIYARIELRYLLQPAYSVLQVLGAVIDSDGEVLAGLEVHLLASLVPDLSVKISLSDLILSRRHFV